MSDAIIRSLGAVFHNNKIYGSAHKVSVMAMEHAYEQLTAFLDEHGHIKLSLTQDAILINDVPCESRSGLAQTVINVLRGWEVNVLTLDAGLTPDEFIRMIQIFEKTPEKILVAGDFSQLLGGAGIGHVRSRNVTLIEVAEEEVVVNRDQAGGGAGGDDATHEARDKRLMAYMAGGTGEGGDITGDMTAAAASASELGHMIITTAHQVVIGAAPSPDTQLNPAEAESLVGKIVESLKRAFEALKQDPSAQTQKGKKELSRTLAELERELQDVLETLVANMAELNTVPIAVAIEEMTEELMVDALATEYLKKRRLIDTSEKRLKRYLTRKGNTGDLAEIKTRLLEGGLDEAGWCNLLAESGLADAPPTSARPTPAVAIPETAPIAGAAGTDGPTRVSAAAYAVAAPTELQGMLDELVGAFTVAISATDTARQEKLRKLVDVVQEQLRAVVEQAEKRLDRMERMAAGEMDDPNEAPETKRARKLSRKEILDILAEVVQEISQPLAVISCAFQVIQPAIAALGESEQDMLRLASESADRMDSLVKMLGRIAGTPQSLSPQPVRL